MIGNTKVTFLYLYVLDRETRRIVFQGMGHILRRFQSCACFAREVLVEGLCQVIYDKGKHKHLHQMTENRITNNIAYFHLYMNI
jgi:hypothetical protein